MRLAYATLVAVVASQPAGAGEMIRCLSKGQSPVTITLDAQRFKARTLSYISGSFVEDMTPCAPDGAYGLSAPTGDAALVAVVDRWQDFYTHDGGVASFFKSADTIYFSGGFNEANKGETDKWDFKLDRISSKAVLAQPGKASVSYVCRRAAPKL